MFENSLQIIKNGIGTAFPAAAVAIGTGHTVFVRQFFGFRQVQPTILDITEDTLFDLASLSKLVATTMVTLKFIENGKLNLNDNIGYFLDNTGNFADCEIRHLLTHTSGLPAWIPLFERLNQKSETLNTILNADKCYKTGEDVCYSCMGYIVLQNILEKVSGEPLDNLAQKYVFSPLGMYSTCYNPAITRSNEKELPIAATERYLHTGEWATGHVHDENAYFLDGIAGNAGVFSTLDDMITFAGMCSEKGITKNGDTYLPREIFDLAIKNHTPQKTEARGLGFQLKDVHNSPMGELMSTGSYGHSGFTGTSFYTDYETGLWGILLTNAVHYGRENRNQYFSIRRKFYDMIITEYQKLKNEGAI